MIRRKAYLSALKYSFELLVRQHGFQPRKAWQLAKGHAAYYAFHASTDHLTHITL